MSNVTTNEAFERLRTYARSHRTSLTDTAKAVLDRTLSL
ncbi:ANTAR domain-containing protein [Arthrobacter sp. SX1312]|nr:ANTAR domain-containing protein [Arthrobacter sp. SX1312]